jgi:hypothetical protein
MVRAIPNASAVNLATMSAWACGARACCFVMIEYIIITNIVMRLDLLLCLSFRILLSLLSSSVTCLGSNAPTRSRYGPLPASLMLCYPADLMIRTLYPGFPRCLLLSVQGQALKFTVDLLQGQPH